MKSQTLLFVLFALSILLLAGCAQPPKPLENITNITPEKPPINETPPVPQPNVSVTQPGNESAVPVLDNPDLLEDEFEQIYKDLDAVDFEK